MPLITSRSLLQDNCFGRIDGPSCSLSSNDSQSVRASSQATGLRKEGERRARNYVARARTMTRTLFWLDDGCAINRNVVTRQRCFLHLNAQPKKVIIGVIVRVQRLSQKKRGTRDEHVHACMV